MTLEQWIAAVCAATKQTRDQLERKPYHVSLADMHDAGLSVEEAVDEFTEE